MSSPTTLKVYQTKYLCGLGFAGRRVLFLCGRRLLSCFAQDLALWFVLFLIYLSLPVFNDGQPNVMTWKEAKKLISKKIVTGTDLNPALSGGRLVLNGPDYICAGKSFSGEQGYRIQTGNNNYLEVPFIMLQNIYRDALNHGNLYNKAIFCISYPLLADIHIGQPNYVQIVGKIFELSGIAVQINSRNYKII